MRSMPRSALFARLVLPAGLLLLAACGSPGPSSAPSSSDAAAPSPEATAAAAGGSAAAGKPPAVAPDPCTLLTNEEAVRLTGTAGVTGTASAPTDGFGNAQMGGKECGWGDGALRVTVTPIDQMGLGPDHVEETRRAMLKDAGGEAVPNLGDGASVTGSTPATMLVMSGPFQLYVRLYTSSREALVEAATLATGRLPKS